MGFEFQPFSELFVSSRPGCKSAAVVPPSFGRRSAAAQSFRPIGKSRQTLENKGF
jgi:hypothetical protein